MVDVCNDVFSDVIAENDVNRSGGVAVDVCNNVNIENDVNMSGCLLYTSPSPRDQLSSRMPSSA